MSPLPSLVQAPTHRRDVYLGRDRVLVKPYASTNTIRDTDIEPIGVIEQNSRKLNENNEEYAVDTGLPATTKLTQIVSIAGGVEFVLRELQPWAQRVSLGLPYAVDYVTGLSTNVSDVSPGVADFDLAAVSGGSYSLRKGSRLLIPVAGRNYERVITGISGLNVTFSPDLHVAPADGAAIKQILEAHLVVCTGVVPTWSVYIFEILHDGRQVQHFLKEVQFLPNGAALNLGDTKKEATMPFNGTSFGYTDETGTHVTHETINLEGDARRT